MTICLSVSMEEEVKLRRVLGLIGYYQYLCMVRAMAAEEEERQVQILARRRRRRVFRRELLFVQ